jgi:hypothetical protein
LYHSGSKIFRIFATGIDTVIFMTVNALCYIPTKPSRAARPLCSSEALSLTAFAGGAQAQGVDKNSQRFACHSQ